MNRIEEIRELCDIRDCDNLDLELPTSAIRELLEEIERLTAELAAYREAEEQGRLVVLPIALGQMVWYNAWDGIRNAKISSRQQKVDGTWKIRISDKNGVFDRPLSSL